MPDFDWDKLNTAWSNYTQSGIPYIKARKTVLAVIGAVVVAVSEGWGDVIATTFENFVLLPLSGTLWFVVELISRAFWGFSDGNWTSPLNSADDTIAPAEGLVDLMTMATTQLANFVSGFGLFAPVIALALLAGFGYAAVRGGEYVGIL